MIDCCVILAAGRNSRLDTGKPKSLLEIDGMALLEHHLFKFSQIGVSHFCIITGHNPHPIQLFVDSVKSKYSATIDLVHNERYDLENGYSLSVAKNWIQKQNAQRFFLTMGDHYFESEFVNAFSFKLTQHNGDHSLYLAVDKPGVWNVHIDVEDVTKVNASDNCQILAIGKQEEIYNFYDTGLFYMSKAVFNVQEKCFTEGKYTLSNMVSALIADDQALIVEISGYFWNDVDNQDDLNNTRKILNELLP
jgi:1L-myo-inositol 1-phosphate cytidylyltransferase